MAFSLPGLVVVDQPANTTATAETFTTVYDYANQNSPELVKELHYNNGRGKITGFVNALGQKKTYASDTVQHKEAGRLSNILTSVTFSGNVFTSSVAHGLQVNDIVWISDGDATHPAKQATVSAVASTTVFTALNNSAGAYGFTAGPVTVIADFSNTFGPGTDPFANGKVWGTKDRINYTGIIKATYTASNSKMTQRMWLKTASGDVKWASEEVERTSLLFDNKYEYTHLFKHRIADTSASQVAGFAQGSKSITEQIEANGQIAYDYIQTLANLQSITRRIKQQNAGITSYTIHCDLTQWQYLQSICAGLNASFVNGSNWGMFNNSMDMGLALNFTSINVNGIMFYFTLLDILDENTALGSDRFLINGYGYYLIPGGRKSVTMSGEEASVPYITLYDRVLGSENRGKKVEIFGVGGTPQKKDSTDVLFTSEGTNILAGANNFFVGKRGTA